MKLDELRMRAEAVSPTPPPIVVVDMSLVKALPPWKGDGYDTAGSEEETTAYEIESLTDYIEKSWDYMKQAMELLGSLGESNYIGVDDRAQMLILADDMKNFMDTNAQTISEAI